MGERVRYVPVVSGIIASRVAPSLECETIAAAIPGRSTQTDKTLRNSFAKPNLRGVGSVGFLREGHKVSQPHQIKLQ